MPVFFIIVCVFIGLSSITAAIFTFSIMFKAVKRTRSISKHVNNEITQKLKDSFNQVNTQNQANYCEYCGCKLGDQIECDNCGAKVVKNSKNN